MNAAPLVRWAGTVSRRSGSRSAGSAAARQPRLSSARRNAEGASRPGKQFDAIDLLGGGFKPPELEAEERQHLCGWPAEIAQAISPDTDAPPDRAGWMYCQVALACGRGARGMRRLHRQSRARTTYRSCRESAGITGGRSGCPGALRVGEDRSTPATRCDHQIQGWGRRAARRGGGATPVRRPKSSARRYLDRPGNRARAHRGSRGWPIRPGRNWLEKIRAGLANPGSMGN